jgi:hypothetical protein
MYPEENGNMSYTYRRFVGNRGLRFQGRKAALKKAAAVVADIY